MAVYVGVDFGARGIVIYREDKGIVMREPNVAAVDTHGNVIAVGSEASFIRGRAPGTVTLRRPITNGEITDFNLTAEILDRFLEIAAPKQKKHVIAAVKYSVGTKSRELLTRALGDCRTGHISVVDSANAAMLGSEISDNTDTSDEFCGNIVCDIGAGSTEAAYIRKDELLRVETLANAGDSADGAIVNYAARKYGIAISPAAAREAKHKLSLCANAEFPVALAGLEKTTGMPKKISVSSAELLRVCAAQTTDVAALLAKLLANLPHHGPDRSTADRIILTGGGALLPGIEGYLSDKIGRTVTLASDPFDCVANGLGAMINSCK